MSKHTPEPWAVERAHDIDAIAWVGQFAVLPVDHATKVMRGNTEEDARRIVACVNACRGLPTDELEQKGLITAVGTQLLAADDRAEGQGREIRRLASIAADAENQLADMLNQRGELLDAAGILADRLFEVPPGADIALDAIRAGIAKVKGEQPI